MPRSGNVRFGASLASALLLLPIAAIADPAAPATQPPAPPPAVAPAKPQAPDPEARLMADRQAFFAAHLAALHAGLLLKPDQEALWAPVEQALQDFAKLRSERHLQDEDNDSIGALKTQGERLVARGEAIKKLAVATGPLMATLTADQKARLPILLEGMRPRRLLSRAFALDEDTSEDHAGPPRDRDHRFSDRDDQRGEQRGDQGGNMERPHHDWDGDRDRADRDGSDGMPQHEWHGHRHHRDETDRRPDDGDGDDETTRS